jgi:probable HAF family extracellular repeat protein
MRRCLKMFVMLLGTSLMLASCGGGGNAIPGEATTSTTTSTTSIPGDTIQPTTPTNLNATAPSATWINLSWAAASDNTGVAGYNIYRNGALLKSVTGTTASDTSLSPDTTYCYTVSAYDPSNNESSQSAQACATTDKQSATSTHTYTFLPTAGVMSASSVSGINDHGDVVGHGTNSSGESRGFLYRNGAYTILLPEGSNFSDATGINDLVDVVGSGSVLAQPPYVGLSQTRGFLYRSGAYTILLPEGWTESSSAGINNNGDVVGSGTDASGQQRGFLYRNGAFTVLLPEGWRSSKAAGVNNNGDVVGSGTDASGQQRGFLYHNGAYTVLHPEGLWQGSSATGINDNGDVIGYATGYPSTLTEKGSPSRGYLYRNATYAILRPENWYGVYPSGINNKGQVVGSGQVAYFGQPLGFLYDNGAYTVLFPEGYASSYLYGINGNGQAVGDGFDASTGKNGCFIATPIPARQ